MLLYLPKPFAFDPENVAPFSPRLLQTHFSQHYVPELTRLAEISESIARLRWATSSSWSIRATARESFHIASSALLHELYFETFGDWGRDPSEALKAAISRDFGSFSSWQQEFVGLAQSLGRQEGWIVLAWNREASKLENHCEAGVLKDAISRLPVLALDLFRHAYHSDFGDDRHEYVSAYMLNVNWRKLEARYHAARAGWRRTL